MQKCVEIADLTPRRSCSCSRRATSPRSSPVAAYVFLTNQDGGVLNDPVMLRIAEDRFWLSTADSDMYLWAKGVSAFSGHEVEIATRRVPDAAAGAEAVENMVDVFGEEILDLRYYWWMRSSVDGIDVVISGTGYSSELGYEVYLLGEARGGELWEILMTAGQPYGISPGSQPHRRIERRTRLCVRHHPDENHSNLVSIDSSRTPISSARPRSRRCATKVFVGAWSASSSTACLAEEQRASLARDDASTKVGFVTNAVHSPRLDRNIAFAMIDVPFDANDTVLTVETVEGTQRRTHDAAVHRIATGEDQEVALIDEPGKMWQSH